MKNTIVVILLSISFSLFSQKTPINHGAGCVLAEKNNPSVATNHPLALELRSLEKRIRKNKTFSLKNTNSCTTAIPVIFHIVDQNPRKVTDGQIASAMVILNNDFNKLNPEIGSLDPNFEPIAANIGVAFKLAQIDPLGNSTTGIDRVVADGICNNTNGGGDIAVNCPVKLTAPAWDTTKYLNIWIINDPYGGTTNTANTSGWAFRAESVPFLTTGEDGIVYNHRYLGTEGSSDAAIFLGDMTRVLTHEVGHYLNLWHTFTGYCSTGSDDFVTDTPKIKYNNCGVSNGTGCCPFDGSDPIYWKSCDGVTTVNYENYMDYSRCPSMFTNGQSIRMQATLQSSIRNVLVSETNQIATGICQNTASVNDLNNKLKFYVFPNPFDETFNIQINVQNAVIKIYTILGELIKEKKIDSNHNISTEINLSSQEAGIYFVEINSNKGSKQLKIIKK